MMILKRLLQDKGAVIKNDHYLCICGIRFTSAYRHSL